MSSPFLKFFSFLLSVLPFLCFLFPSPSLIFYSVPPSSCISFLLQICLFLCSHGGLAPCLFLHVCKCLCRKKLHKHFSLQRADLFLALLCLFLHLPLVSIFSFSLTNWISLSPSPSLLHTYTEYFFIRFWIINGIIRFGMYFNEQINH